MIQPNELRIGNYVLDEGQVYEITLYDFYNYHEDSGITSKEPIPRIGHPFVYWYPFHP